MLLWISLFLSLVVYVCKCSAGDPCIMTGNVKYTRCLNPSPNVVKSGLDKKYIKEILDFHNQKRSAAPGTKLMKMYWNENLASTAQKWADQCQPDHDYLNARSVPGWGIPIGQNLGFNLKDPMDLVRLWYSEKSLWDKGKRTESLIGHYTQMMNAETSSIGCGFSTCIRNEYHFVCNYAVSQPKSSYYKPYETGQNCEGCPSKCVDGLCDCQGRICFYLGTMDANECKCKCYPNFQGDFCEQKKCIKDDPKCGNIPKRNIKYYCNRYANIPVECPFLCGICP